MASNVGFVFMDHYVKIPMLISAFSCGNGTPFSDGFTYEEVPSKLIKNDFCYLLHVSGNSMNPTLQEGDRCLVDVLSTPRHNNIVAAVIGGEFVVKRYVQQGFSQFLKSDNPNYRAIKLTEDETIKIIGVIYEILRKV